MDKKTTKNQASSLRAGRGVEWLRNLTDALPLLISYVDKEQRYQFNNKAYEDWFGRSRDEIKDRHVAEVLGAEAYQVLLPHIEKVLAGDTVTYEVLSPYKDGGERYIRATYVPDFDVNGSVEGFFVVVEDLSTRKVLEEQLLRSQKMEAVGQLTGGIAHDFNNILGIIAGNLELVKMRVKNNAEADRFTEAALKGTRRGADITKKLLEFSRQEGSNASATLVNGILMQMQDLVAKSLTASVTVITDLADDLWPVEIDHGDFENTILNLSLNARDAMPGGGTLTIRTTNKVVEKISPETEAAAISGDFVVVSVSDTGAGMTEAVKEKIFEPFFTTKEVGSGSGLGLSMVYGFVERSGGHIMVHTEPGAGAEFQIYLPRSLSEAVDVEAAVSDPSETPGGTETVLIVDDEEELRDIGSAFLEKLGYTTLTASNGGQALEILQQSQGIDLLFCDVVMPGKFDGYQVASAARQNYPALKILMTTGFVELNERIAKSQRDYSDILVNDILRKPYSHDTFAAAIRQALDNEA